MWGILSHIDPKTIATPASSQTILPAFNSPIDAGTGCNIDIENTSAAEISLTATEVLQTLTVNPAIAQDITSVASADPITATSINPIQKTISDIDITQSSKISDLFLSKFPFKMSSKMDDDPEALSLDKAGNIPGSPLYVTNRYIKFWFLVIGILFFFGLHNYMQELIMTLPGFKVGIVLGYLEVLGVAACSFAERKYLGETTRKAPWSTYMMLCFCLLISSATSNIALAYINYPTKVVFRSCKLIPTMIIAVLYNKKKVHWFEFAFGTLISVGMIFFAVADFQVYPKFNFIGIILVSISVIADAFLPNFQERVFDHGSSRIEVTFFTNIITLTVMTVAFIPTGDLPTAFFYALDNPYALQLFVTYTFLAYIAITFHMALVKEFGGIITVLVGNTRKAITIVLSFLLFPKPMSIYYSIGGFLVFGSLVGNAFLKERAGSSSGGKRDGGFGGM